MFGAVGGLIVSGCLSLIVDTSSFCLNFGGPLGAVGAVGARITNGRLALFVGSPFLTLSLGARFGAVGERVINGLRILLVDSSLSSFVPVTKSTVATGPVILRKTGGRAPFRVLPGPNLLPRPGLGPASRRSSAMELKPPSAVVARAAAGRGRSDGFVSRDCSTLNTPGVSKIAGVLLNPESAASPLPLAYD